VTLTPYRLCSFLQRRYVVYKVGEDPDVKAEKDKALLELVRKKRQWEKEQKAKEEANTTNEKPLQ
jgi:hypothetical protein